MRGALAQHGIDTQIRPTHLSPPNSRRRASLKALRKGRRTIIGFHEEKSRTIVDMRECHVLRPELFGLVEPLRGLFASLSDGRRGEIQMTLADQGVDLVLKGWDAQGLEAVEALNAFAVDHRLARVAIDDGNGPEIRFEPRPVTMTLSGTAVPMAPGGFIQATADGEAALVEAVREVGQGARRSADLFAGMGTFALALDGRVYAAEASRDAILALKRAAPAVLADHRDLYRRPLTTEELAAFDFVVLDPPRAGAQEQVRMLAASTVPRLAYVSCNPATFARDARILADGGYRLSWVRPVGQFRWSTHVELAAAFTRQ